MNCIVNRFIRLYPCYIVVVIMSFVNSNMCKFHSAIYAMFFLETNVVPRCSATSWTVNVDFQTYLVLVVLAGVLGKHRLALREKILWVMVILGITKMMYVLVMARYKYSELVDDPNSRLNEVLRKERMILGVEGTTDEETIGAVNWNARDYYLKELLADHKVLEFRKFAEAMGEKMYFTSFWGHGCSMILGSLAAIKYSTKPNAFRAFSPLKIIVSCALLYATSGFWVTAGFPLYFLFEQVLTLHKKGKTSSLSMVSTCFYKILSNSLWSFMSPYTYAMYSLHLFVLFGINQMPFAFWNTWRDLDIEKKLACESYTMWYVAKLTSAVLLGSFIASILIRRLWEAPVQQLLRRYLKSLNATKST